MKKLYSILSIIALVLLLHVSLSVKAETVATEEPTTSTETTETTEATTEIKVDPNADIFVPSYVEPANSDLKMIHAKTILDCPRWVQSFTCDDKYYYYVQMTDPDKGNLRITRVKYNANGSYYKDHMDLLGFGHGTNIDCSVYKGKTYLWIGSCMNLKTKRTEAISCFQYKKNAVYRRKAGNTYTIRVKGSLKKATNVFPAVSENSKYLVVRYTDKGKQYFQKYYIYYGKKIKTYKCLSKLVTNATVGDFQGFEVKGNDIYTIEGSPTALFLSGYDSSRVFQPTVLRRINMKTKSKSARVIKGAQCLPFREPEGLNINKKGQMTIMFVSNILIRQHCNVYRIK